MWLAPHCLLVLLALTLCLEATNAEEWNETLHRLVGPDAMPAAIAAYDPPFSMASLSRPTFAERSITITEKGATAGQSELVTDVIQQSIDKLSALGGGTVVVPAGKWKSGRISLKSNVCLHFEEGAELQFSGELKDYLPVVFSRYEGLELMGFGALIYAHGQENIAVTGRGTLLGPKGGPIRKALKGLSDQIVDPNSPVSDRIYDGQDGQHYFRPYFICPINCKGVFIEGVSLKNGPMWNIVPIYCERVVVRGVSIDSRGVVNGDGVNIESSKDVLVEYCHVATGDDCFALKAGRNADGLRSAHPVENVIIRYNSASSGFGGITSGSETAGGIRNVHVHDCLFENVRHAAYLKTRRPRGGGGDGFLIERIVFNSYHHAIMFDMLGAPIYVGELAHRLPALPINKTDTLLP